jgi:D-3-phosphoglycerate dehydrogenase / 2-oxoglutarate reductase
MLDAKAIAKMKPGVRIINCARGGLIDEAALLAALNSGHVAGAALDVFLVEPAKENALFGHENVICTPHLGAATTEAQENVALQVAEQMADYLLTGAITNALNFPSISAAEAPKLNPYVKLAEQLGSFAGQLTESMIIGIRVEYAGEIATLNVKPLTAAVIAGVLRASMADINMVSAGQIARDRGITVDEATRRQDGAYESYVRVTVKTAKQERAVAGTVFSDGKPRIIQVKGIEMEAQFYPNMLYVTNDDRPGFIGRVGALMGELGINIARLNLGRDRPEGNAIALIAVDQPVDAAAVKRIEAFPNVHRAHRLVF